MTSIHRFMPILPSNRMPSRSLASRSMALGETTRSSKGARHDHAQTHARRHWRPRRAGSSRTRSCRHTREAQGPGDGSTDSPNQTRERNDGDQTKRLTALGQGTDRLVHRLRTSRSLVPGARSGTCSRRQRHVRAWRAHGLAHPSTRLDVDRHVRPRLGAGLGRPGRGGPPGRRGLVSAGREALAWGDTHDGDDTHRPPGGAGR